MTTGAPQIAELLQSARQGDTAALGQLLELYRQHLRGQAERQLQGQLTVRVDSSDVVQQTFLEAHRSFSQFLGQAEAELAAWLLRILDHNIAGVIRDHKLLQKRDVRRERPLDDPQGSKPGLKQQLDAGHSTPSQRAIRLEDETLLNQALAALPEDQREAVRLRHLKGWSLSQIAQHFGRSPVAVASLIKRGMQALRKHLGDATP
jgi:RNA polymerase sigma-70 factor (ECF subfamily)